MVKSTKNLGSGEVFIESNSAVFSLSIPDGTILAKLGSIHITSYLFTMSHGPVQTDRGSRQYIRAVSRGIAYELSPTVSSGYLNTAVPHILYNAAVALRSRRYI